MDDTEEQVCTLWVHNEAFAKEDVLFNATSFPKSFASSALFNLTPFMANVGVRDFQATATASVPANRGGKGTAYSTVSSSNRDGRQGGLPKSSALLGRNRHEKRFTFTATDMEADMKAKHPNLQVTSVYTCCIGLS